MPLLYHSMKETIEDKAFGEIPKAVLTDTMINALENGGD